MLRRANVRNETEAVLLPDYGKKKLLNYADTFRDLARTFTYIPETAVSENQNSSDRQNIICQSRLLENREILADHLNEMAQIMTHVAEEAFCLIRISEKKKRQLAQILKTHGILVQDIYMIENARHHFEVNMQLKTIKAKHFSTEEIAGLLSVILNKRLVSLKNSIVFIKDEYGTFTFEEEAKYGVLTGVAKAVKENEVMSGDNYSFMEIGNGSFLSAISDGMGSGEKACRDSGMVVDLLEKLLEAGFRKETAIQMINGTLIARDEEQNMSTLDLCEIDLYSGVCNFMKVGAAASFIKRKCGVEIIEEDSLPLGIFHQMEIESELRPISDGDYVIMVSDGIVDALQRDESVFMLQEFIGRIKMENPREIANHILQFVICAGNGKIKDDMTVMVIGAWENDQRS